MSLSKKNMNIEKRYIEKSLLLISATVIGLGLLKTAIILVVICALVFRETLKKKLFSFRRENLFFIMVLAFFSFLILLDKNSFTSIYNLKTRLHFTILTCISLIILNIPDKDKEKKNIFFSIVLGSAISFIPMLIQNFFTLRCDLTYFINTATNKCDHIPDGSFYFLTLTFLLTIPNILKKFSIKLFLLSTLTYITAYFWGSRTGYYSLYLTLIVMILALPNLNKLKSAGFFLFYFLLNYPVDYLIEIFNKYAMSSPLYVGEASQEFNHSIINKMKVLGLGLNGRKELWIDGIKKLALNPMGDFIPSPLANFGDYQTYWFHNLWIDTAARSGLIPLVLLLLIGISAIFKIFQRGDLKSQATEFFPLIMIMAIACNVVVYDRSAPVLYLYISLCFLITTTAGEIKE